eukprot:scaffold74053_cov63-Cyclotella_meneghiniana.AAC.1
MKVNTIAAHAAFVAKTTDAGSFPSNDNLMSENKKQNEKVKDTGFVHGEENGIEGIGGVGVGLSESKCDSTGEKFVGIVEGGTVEDKKQAKPVPETFEGTKTGTLEVEVHGSDGISSEGVGPLKSTCVDTLGVAVKGSSGISGAGVGLLKSNSAGTSTGGKFVGIVEGGTVEDKKQQAKPVAKALEGVTAGVGTLEVEVDGSVGIGSEGVELLKSTCADTLGVAVKGSSGIGGAGVGRLKTNSAGTSTGGKFVGIVEGGTVEDKKQQAKPVAKALKGVTAGVGTLEVEVDGSVGIGSEGVELLKSTCVD